MKEVNRVQRITIIDGVVVGLVAILAIMSVIFGQKKLEIVNFDQIENNLSGKEKEKIEESVYLTLINANVVEDNKSGIKAMIRNSSYSEKRDGDMTQYSFLVDMDEPRMTYQLSFALVDGKGFYEAPIVECPEPTLMKYPEEDCSGGRTSTMSVTLGKYLPYYFHLDSGQFVTVTSVYSVEEPNNLNVRVSSCGDKSVIDKTRAEIEAWILELGYEPERYKISIPEYCDGSAN